MYKTKLASRAFVGLVSLSLLLTLSVSYSAAQPATAPTSPSSQGQPAAQSASRPAYSNVQWSAAQNISGGNGELYPGVAMNAGEAQVNFKGSSTQEIYESYSSDNGHSWAAPTYRGCDNGSARGSTAPSIAEDANKNVYMVWEDYCGPTRQLYFKKHDATSNQWQATRQIVSSNSNGGSVAVGPNGVIHVSYINVFASGSSGQLEYIYSTNGGASFSAPTVLTNSAEWINTSHIAVDTLNRPHIVCEKGPSGRYSIVAEDFVNGAWHTTTIYTGRGYWSQIAANHSGGVGAVWQMNDAGDQILYSRWNGASQTWDAISTQVSVDSSNNYYPTLTYDNLDDAYVVWGQSSGSPGSQQLQFSYEQSIGNWSAEINIQSTRTSVAVLANYNNNLTVAYQFDGTGNWGIWSSWLQLPQANFTPTSIATPTHTATRTNTPTNTATATFCPGQTFTDVNCSFWAFGYIKAMNDANVINGYSGAQCTGVHVGSPCYLPSNLVTRAEVTKMLARAEAWPAVTVTSPHFTDVPPNYWAFQFIERAVANGVADGLSAQQCQAAGATPPCYLPNSPLTRAQMTKFVYRAHHPVPYTPSGTQTFTDVPPSYFAYGYIETANHDGIVTGYTSQQCTAAGATFPCFLPNRNVHRDEVAKMVKKMLDAGSVTSTPTVAPTSTATNTPTNTNTPTLTSTAVATSTNTPTPTSTNTPAPPTSTPLSSTNTLTPVPTVTVTPTPTITPGIVNVNIVDYAFSPQTITVTLGTRVIWTNTGTMTHTVNSDDGSSFASGNIAPSGTFSRTFTTTGTIGYHCTIHGGIHTGMYGTVVVLAADHPNGTN